MMMGAHMQNAKCVVEGMFWMGCLCGKEKQTNMKKMERRGE